VIEAAQSELPPVSYLPTDCLLHVFSLLPLSDLLRVACVSKEWSRVAAMRSLWTRVDTSGMNVVSWSGLVAALERNGTIALDLCAQDATIPLAFDCPLPQLRELTLPDSFDHRYLDLCEGQEKLDVLITGCDLDTFRVADIGPFIDSLGVAGTLRCLRIRHQLAFPPFSFS